MVTLVRALDRKLLRDCLRTKGQLIAIALVLAAGLGLHLGMRTTMRSLESARADYYATERFGDVFASLVRAPDAIEARLRAIPGVDRLQTRIVAQAVLDVPGCDEVVSGRLVSLPLRHGDGRPQVCDLWMREGRLPSAERPEEVVVLWAFAEAHGLAPGDRLGATIDGRHTSFVVVGTAYSPEFTYVLGPGRVLPDDRRFGVLWMGREALGRAFDMDGAFDDVTLTLAPGADLDEVLARVDAQLETYGGQGAIARKDQISESFIANELEQLRSFGTLIPAMFLVVAAFLFQVVIGRIVAGQREQIAALKAVGLRDLEVGMHFGKLAGLVLIVACAIGILLAAILGRAMCRMYGEFYRFPQLHHVMPLGDVVIAVVVAAIAAAAGAGGAVLSAVRLQPAEAMRPLAPHRFRATLVERIGLARLLSPAARMVLREIERKPGRALSSIVGIALATALMVISTFAYGSIGRAINVQFGLQQRADVTLALSRPRATSALRSVAGLPGVRSAEPFRMVPVRLRNGALRQDLAVLGIPRDASLHRILDVDLRAVAPLSDGLAIGRRVAEKLGVKEGDEVEVDVREGSRPTRMVRVAQVIETYIGLTASMELGALCRMLRETESMNGAWLMVDRDRRDDLHAEVKRTPMIAGIDERDGALETFRTMIDENLGTSLAINVGFALVMALGVLYNAGRIILAERVRDLASLRVLGFRRREVTAILLGEIAVLTITAIPLGLLLGHLGARSLMDALDTDQIRMPFVIAPWTDALAVATVLVATAIAGFLAWRKLERVDIVEVLKTRD